MLCDIEALVASAVREVRYFRGKNALNGLGHAISAWGNSVWKQPFPKPPLTLFWFGLYYPLLIILIWVDALNILQFP